MHGSRLESFHIHCCTFWYCSCSQRKNKGRNLKAAESQKSTTETMPPMMQFVLILRPSLSDEPFQFVTCRFGTTRIVSHYPLTACMVFTSLFNLFTATESVNLRKIFQQMPQLKADSSQLPVRLVQITMLFNDVLRLIAAILSAWHWSGSLCSYSGTTAVFLGRGLALLY